MIGFLKCGDVFYLDPINVHQVSCNVLVSKLSVYHTLGGQSMY